ncbi:MAG: NUDIX domain-containing protein [Parcubacteria group bacterium]|jgi:ADP-ribose pyrophosphatase YjhB (NUDIX family)
MNQQNQIFSGVAVIIENKKGELLLHLRDENAPYMKNQWCLLGGRIDNKSQETPEHAAAREINEEIGIVVNPKSLKLFKEIILKDGASKSYIFHTILNLSSDEIKLGEGKEFRFFPKRELLDMLKKLEYTNSFLEVLTEFVKLKQLNLSSSTSRIKI